MAGLFRNQLLTALPSTTIEGFASAARAHAAEKPVGPFPLQPGYWSEMLFHGSARFARSP